jgi:cell division protein ZapA (FtsZ GTPase activity inhibitor)
MVSGRVRDLHFTVTLTSSGQKSAVKLPDVQEDALEQIAEQIAGNLF